MGPFHPLRMLMLLATVLMAAVTALGQTPDLAGMWSGQCFGCAARGFTLKLMQQGDGVAGTIQTEGTPNFGDSEKPLIRPKLSGSKLSFQVKGDPGDMFEVELTVSRDGKSLSGNGYYRGSFGLKFVRTGP